jgi:hypothetical protein
MGYFDGLTSGSFKTAEDGRRLFFPWGVLGSGYAIASEQDYLRLRQQVKAYMVVTLVLVIASGMYEPYRAPLAAAALLVCFYLAWMWRVLPRLRRSDEKLLLQECMTAQARAHGPVVLWLMESLPLHSSSAASRCWCSIPAAGSPHSPAPSFSHFAPRKLRACSCCGTARLPRAHSGQTVEIAVIPALFRWDRRTTCGIKPEPRTFGAT